VRPLPYPLVCALIGVVLGWAPRLFHGPIPEKFDLFYISGALAVWAFYTARMLIGFWVGVSTWPEAWWLRGPLCGFLSMLPVTFFSLAVPTCGPACMGWNLTTGTLVGLAVGGVAFLITGRSRA
jgi:hypothetical protein